MVCLRGCAPGNPKNSCRGFERRALQSAGEAVAGNVAAAGLSDPLGAPADRTAVRRPSVPWVRRKRQMSEALEWSIDRGALALWRTRFDAIYDCRPCRRTLFLRCGALTNFLISRKPMVLCRSRN